MKIYITAFSHYKQPNICETGTDLLWNRSLRQHDSYSVKDRLIGLVVKASALKVEDPGFESHL